MTTLAEIIARLPDNTVGAIDADDIRAAVEAVWERFDATTAVEAFQFDTAITDPPHAAGLLHWSSDSNTLNIDSEIPGVSLQVGQEQWTHVRNSSGATILNGAPVQIIGASGTRPLIAPDDGQGRVFGLATHDIPNNTFGIVTSFGLVRDVDTAAFVDGAAVYADASGALTTSITASFVGYVLLAHPTQGAILARPTSLDQADGTTAQRPATVSTGFMYFDTTLNAPVWWNGTAWVNASGVVA